MMNTDSGNKIQTDIFCRRTIDGLTKWTVEWIPVFIVNMVISAIVYSLLMCNQLVNQLDGMWHGSVSYANAHELSIGRWFWRFLDKGRLYLSPDPITSVISLMFFSFSIILILDGLNVKGRFARYAASLLFMVNISVLVLLSYRYMSPTFSVSCFLAVFSAYILVKFNHPLIIFTVSPLSIALMLGLYQANFGCFCLFLLVYISLHLYKNDMTGKDLGLFILRAFISLIIGAILYYALLQLNLWHYNVEMASYNGADSYDLPGIIKNLPSSFLHTYGDFSMYFKNDWIRSNVFSGKLYIIVFILLGIHFVKAACDIFKAGKLYTLLFIASLLLIPAACNAVLMIAYNSVTSIQMTIPMSLCIPILLCLASHIPTLRHPAGTAYRIALALFTGILLYGNYLMAIYDEQAMYMGTNSLRELTSQITDSLQMYNLYHPYYKYVFVGRPADSPLFAKDFVYDRANEYARIGTWDPDDTRWVVQSWQGFFTYEMGINLSIADDDKLEEALRDETVRNMPVFPEYGSMALLNDVVVIKLSDDYEVWED
ncbi:MAG: glucosyltransferase domain-containing protein [Lachnospiraceae bacterium]|nr:glucosyltransferase domain-containing protein [Lachnospiraceae bacterium]